MALQAERAHIGEVAFASAFRHGHDVVGVPQVAATAPIFLELAARGVIQLAFVLAQSFGVQAALRADATVAQEDSCAQIAGIGAQFPLVDASVRAEGEASLGDLAAAPAARLAAALANPPPGLCAAGAHSRKS